MNDSCEACQENLGALMDDALEAADAEAVRKHLEACAGCRREQTLLEGTVRALRSLDPLPVPSRFRERLKSRLQTEALMGEVKARHRRGLAMAASVALMAGLALGLAVGNLPALASGTDGPAVAAAQPSGAATTPTPVQPVSGTRDDSPVYLGATETDETPRDYYLDPSYRETTPPKDELPAVVFVGL